MTVAVKSLQSTLCPSQASSDASEDNNLPGCMHEQEAAGHHPLPRAAEVPPEIRKSPQSSGKCQEMCPGFLKFAGETMAILLASGPTAVEQKVTASA